MFGRKAVTVRIEAELTWHFAYDHDGKQWLGVCRELNLNSFGDTFQEAQDCAVESIQLLLQDLFGDGELDAFLYRNGWRPVVPIPAGQKVHFDVPFESRMGASTRELIPA